MNVHAHDFQRVKIPLKITLSSMPSPPLEQFTLMPLSDWLIMDEVTRGEDQVSSAVDEQSTMLMNEEQVSSPDVWSDTLLIGLHQLQSRQQLCDAAVLAGDGTTFYVHTVVMAASSAILAEYLTEHTEKDLARSPTGHILLPLHASCGKVAESLVRFFYTGVLSCEADSILEVIGLGEQLGIQLMDTLRSRIQKEGILSAELFALKAEDSAAAAAGQEVTEIIEESNRHCHEVPEIKLEDNGDGESGLASSDSLKENSTNCDQEDGGTNNLQRTPRRSSRKCTRSREGNPKDEHMAPEVTKKPSATDASNSSQLCKRELRLGSREHDEDSLASVAEPDTKTRSESSEKVIKSRRFKTRESATCPKMRQSMDRKKSAAREPKPLEMGPWTCAYCGKTYSRKRVLRTHEIMCSGQRPFPCKLCDRKYPVKWQLDTHMLKHTGERPFQCKYCGNTFTTKSAMDTHERYFCRQGRLHLQQDRLTCENCRISFWSLRCLEDHKCDAAQANPANQPGATLFQCHLCARIFPFNQSLKIHLKTHFEQPKPHACSLCNKRYSHKFLLLKHEKKHRGEKDIKCGYCTKTFYRREDCRQHERVHTGEKPYSCSLCTKRFTSPSALKVHEKRHRKEFNYKCRECAKAFVDSTSLKKHVNDRHTDIRPYVCLLCSKAFKRRYGLQSHYRKMHKDRAEEFVHSIPPVNKENSHH